MDDSCAVCAENLEWVAYGSCGHREVCSTCIVRLRFVIGDPRCCICKTESPIVFVTKALGDYTRTINDFSTFPSAPREGRVGAFWYHEDTQAFFDDLDQYRMIKAMCRLSCSVCDKAEDQPREGGPRHHRQRIKSVEQLKGHLYHKHKLHMCGLCLEGRKIFICEQKLYTRAQLNQHIHTGDSEVDGSESERGGFAGHPMCEFCRNPFYGDNELYTHMSTEHYTCHLCQRSQPGQYEYYKNYDDLEIHFRRDHYLCEDDSCLAKKFIVFQNESELKRHNAIEHGGKMSRSQRSAALQIPTSFRYRRGNDQENRRGRARSFRREPGDDEYNLAVHAALRLSEAEYSRQEPAPPPSNCYPSGSLKKSLIIADVRCLPGMEGAPVFDKNGNLIGILIRPLRQKNSGVEIQLVVPWGAITTACSHLLLEEPSDEGKARHLGNEVLSIKPDASIPVQEAVEKAMESICLITVNDGVWASGILLNEHGLILTNAHLLEPWRFGKGGVYGEANDTGSKPTEEFPATRSRFWEQESPTIPRKAPADLYSSVGENIKEYKHNFLQTGHRDIRVRLYHQDSWTWCPAKVVYICKEQLDVALLQLEYVPGKLQPIAANFSSPPVGTTAHVVGHGLFGPRCGLSPSICSGVVAKVVHAKMRLKTQSISQDVTEFPAMLETTAAVHPGGSGGAVLNSSGQMIGLVTSNARHGAGTVIPHLNFSIPCAVLAPIFEFAEDMQNKEILQTLDQPNEELSSIWALMSSLSPKTEQPLPNLPKLLKDGNNKQKKGSQFAKFIAETQDMFIKPTKLSRDMIPSKL